MLPVWLTGAQHETQTLAHSAIVIRCEDQGPEFCAQPVLLRPPAKLSARSLSSLALSEDRLSYGFVITRPSTGAMIHGNSRFNPVGCGQRDPSG